MKTISSRHLKRSFHHAFDGLIYIFKTEQNFRIQAVIGFLVFILAFIFPLSISQKTTIVLLISVVLILELLNSVFERTVDLLKPRIDPGAGLVKNIMSGTVLLAVFASVVVGFIIFYPVIF